MMPRFIPSQFFATAATFSLLATALTVLAGKTQETGAQPNAEKSPALQPLELLAEDKHPALGKVEIKGDNPSVVYVPIIHDGPLNHLSSTDIGDVKTILGNCKTLCDHLHENYGIRNILLEGVSKGVADWYNKPEMNWREFSWGNTRMVTYDTWGAILSSNRWHLAPAFDKKPLGPLTLLGREYSDRINQALKKSKEQGWFKTRNAFVDNQEAFTASLNEACDGYNSKLAEIIKQDPGLKREYEITVTQRNGIFLDHLAVPDGPGILLCGAGHYHDLVAQLNKRDVSYIVAIPAGMEWPPLEKDDEKIFADMRKLGCQLKQVTLKFGDGGAAKIKLPIE